MWKRCILTAILSSCLVSGHLISKKGVSVWSESTFQDFKKGSFGDAGANTYVSSSGRIQTINRWDVNGDGYLDILCANSHPLIEMLDMSIYWGNGKDFSIERHSYVPANGPMWVVPADLNLDGEIDLVVANYSNGTWTRMDSAVYWGRLKDAKRSPADGDWSAYPFKARTLLPSQNAQSAAVADFNKDGFPDIVFAFSAGFWEYRGSSGEAPSRIYWNNAGEFHPSRYGEIGTRGATDVATADFDSDGWIDIVFANGEGPFSYVYWGHPDGFSESRRTELPTLSAHGVKAADIDNNGVIDVVFANEVGEVSYAYLNRTGSFQPFQRIEFETHSAKDVVVADFNKDGMNDIFFSNHQDNWMGNPRFANRVIESFLYYGSESGFSNENRISLQTLGAWGVNAADLNSDGWTDILVCNFQEHYSYEVPSFIYWNGPDGFDITRRTPLYEHGAQGNAIADFNGDGHLDVLIVSMMAESRGDYDPSYLYFGNKEGQYSVDRRVELVGREPYEQAMADLDDDGDVDILLLNRGETARLENEVWVYWNKNNQFDPWRMTGLPFNGGAGVEVSDLDRDGYLDIIVSGQQYKGVRGETRHSTFIYWGGPSGWVTTERSVLNISNTRRPAIADLNSDGHLDLAFSGAEASIFWGDGSRNYRDQRRLRLEAVDSLNQDIDVADLNRDGYLDIVMAAAEGASVLIFYGDQSASYSSSQRIADVQAKTITIADVNQDGWLDLVCPFYKQNGRRSINSWILLGGSDGFRKDRRVELPADGATGSIVSDFNFDGNVDVFFFCHRNDGSSDEAGRYADHHTESRLYWGSPDGFQTGNYLGIPSVGTHYDVGIDLGHIRDRGFEFDYISSAFDTQGRRPYSLEWVGQTPPGTSIKFQVRSADSTKELSQVGWMGPGGPGTYYTHSGSRLHTVPAGRWLQYRAILNTGNGVGSPIVDSVEISFVHPDAP